VCLTKVSIPERVADDDVPALDLDSRVAPAVAPALTSSGVVNAAVAD